MILSGGASTYQQTAIISAKVKMDLELSGIVANVKKSQWHPSQESTHLGFLVDLKNAIFTVPKSRIDKLKDLLRQLHGKTCTMARFLAQVVGMIISMGLGIEPVWCTVQAVRNITLISQNEPKRSRANSYELFQRFPNSQINSWKQICDIEFIKENWWQWIYKNYSWKRIRKGNRTLNINCRHTKLIWIGSKKRPLI